MTTDAIAPVKMILHCPVCGLQHVDTPQPEKNWENPPHRTHECQLCGFKWRPADVPTTGVERIETRGASDDDGYPRREAAKAMWASNKPYAWDDWAEDDDWDAETSAPSRSHFAGVVQTYAWMQQRERVTVEEIATALNVEPQRVIEVVQWHIWMYLEGPDDQPLKQWIEHEGE